MKQVCLPKIKFKVGLEFTKANLLGLIILLETQETTNKEIDTEVAFSTYYA